MELIERLIGMNDADALKDAFELTRELEEKGSFIGTDFSGSEKRHYDEENFTKAHEYSRECEADKGHRGRRYAALEQEDAFI